jgi:hypothetical protein
MIQAKEWEWENWGLELHLDQKDLTQATQSLKNQHFDVMGQTWGTDSIQVRIAPDTGLVIDLRLGMIGPSKFDAMGTMTIALEPKWDPQKRHVITHKTELLNLQTPFPAWIVALAKPAIQQAIATELQNRSLVDLSNRWSSRWIRRVQTQENLLKIRYTLW